MIDILRNRRSVRSFTTERISGEHIKVLEEALLRAPTSRNFEPCEFIVVREKDKLNKLSELKAHGCQFLSGCDTAFVICADTAKSDVTIEDCSIASIILQLTGESLGLGSCWVQVRLRNRADGTPSEKYLRQLFSMPDNIQIVSVVGMGHPAQEKVPRPADSLKAEKIHHESY